MICEGKIHMQLLLEGLAEKSAENPNLALKLKPDKETRHMLALEKQKQYRKEYKKKYRERDREKHRLQTSRYYYAHRAKRLEQLKRSIKKNWETVKARQRRYRKQNREKIRAYFRNYLPAWRAKHRLENPQYLIKDRMYSCLKRGLKGQGLNKFQRTEEMVGCTMTELKQHIEKQFVNGMDWSEPDSFAIDHIVPIVAFNLLDDEERKWAFHWQNLRPLDPVENKRKSDKLPTPLPSWLPAHIAQRIITRSLPALRSAAIV